MLLNFPISIQYTLGMKISYLYIIGSKDGPYKMGFSVNPNRRNNSKLAIVWIYWFII